MLYKELFDGLLIAHYPHPSSPDLTSSIGILPTDANFSWEGLFGELGLNMAAEFSDDFVLGSKAIVLGNGIRFGVDQIRCLDGLVQVWRRYVDALGLGEGDNSTTIGRPAKIEETNSGVMAEASGSGRTEDRLELVYRRAGVGRKGKGKAGTEVGGKATSRRKGKRRRKVDTDAPAAGTQGAPIAIEINDDDEVAMQQAIEASLATIPPAPGQSDESTVKDDLKHPSAEHPAPDQTNSNLSDDEAEREEDELAWAVEMSLGVEPDTQREEPGEVILRTSQPVPVGSPDNSPLSSPPSTPPATTQVEKPGSKSGSIIGKTVFKFDKAMLEEHVKKALGWWTGMRDAEGVAEEDVRRCGWCEFEEGCEWR
jgi:exonuclease V